MASCHIKPGEVRHRRFESCPILFFVAEGFLKMDTRLEAMAKRCKNRGGDCPCIGRCQAMDAVDRELGSVAIVEREVKQNRERLESMRRRISSPMATLKHDFVFAPNLDPVIVFDGEDATFGYENRDGEWIEQNAWPFNEDFVWADDCERLGFRVE